MLTIAELQEAAGRTVHEVREIHHVSQHVVKLLEAYGDHAAAEHLTEVAQHSTKELLTLVFAGEHKCGKSSLINAILGERLIATAPNDATSVVVEIRPGDRDARFAVVPDEADGTLKVEIDDEHYFSLQTMPEPELDGVQVLWLEAELSHPLLDAGLVFVDTPSISGGMQSSAAAAILGRLSFAHALIFVTDISQELTAPELEFMEIAATLCPHQVVVATKTDLYPEWHRIVEVDEGHLERSELGGAPTVIPTASPLRWAAIRLNDGDLDRESGIPLLVWYLGVTVITEARLAAVRVAAEVAEAGAVAMVAAAEERVSALAGTTERKALEDKLEALRDRFAALTEEKQYRYELDRALAEFSTSIDGDLQSRRNTARSDVKYGLDELTGPRDWSRFEAELNGTWNDVLAQHLAFTREAISTLTEQIQRQLEIELDEVDLRAAGGESVTGELDRPSRPTSSLWVPLRNAGIGGGFAGTVGAVAAPLGLALGPLLVPLGAAFAAAGFMFGRRMSDKQSIAQWRAAAEREVNEYQSSVFGMIHNYSRSIQVEVPIRVRKQFTKAIDAEGARTRAEIDRTGQMLMEAQNRSDEAVRQAEAELAHAELVHSHARRLSLRLLKPELVDR